jgi:hypothetical protein
MRIKFGLTATTLFVIISHILLAQCTEDAQPRDFSEGKCLTHRMYSVHFKDYQTMSQEWNEHTAKWIPLQDFIQVDLQFFRNSKPEGYYPRCSVDSNIYYFMHGDSQKRRMVFHELSYQNLDTLVFLINQTFLNETSSRMKIDYALKLKLTTNPKSIGSLISLSNDSCKYVRLEAALSLSYLNEKKVSFKTFQNLWNLNDEVLNLDHFQYFTVGMRNIATPEALQFLIELTKQKNPFCCLDASICLLQLGKTADCLTGLDSVLSCDNEMLFYNAGLVIKKYYSFSVLKKKLSPYLSGDDYKAQFSRFLLADGK